MSNRVLVTGAGGFVGGHMVEHLVRQGQPVRAMVRDASRADALKKLDVEIVEADLRDAKSLVPAVEGVHGVYHIASLFRQAGFPESVFHDSNAEGTRRLLDAAIAAGVKRVIHCSTVGVLGNVANPPGTEETPYSPGDMYQRSKMEGEKIALDYFRSGRIGGVVIRPAMIYGPGDTRNLKLWRMVARKRFFYVGPGQCSVHFIDVRDLVRAFELAMQKENLNGEVYIIPGQKAVPLNVMVNLVADRLGVPRPWLHLPVKPMQWLGSLCEAVCTPLRIQPPIFRRRVDFYTKNRHFDGSKAARDLGFAPAKSFEEEIAEITDWYKEHGWL
ncbi:MAG: NAD-dependent epimerase/dehydratase family protein [Kiritimatiellae bacterium]|nr:NAD-dependent epimerase/dehydratase family protein [Kiritimatiellia bacterium]